MQRAAAVDRRSRSKRGRLTGRLARNPLPRNAHSGRALAPGGRAHDNRRRREIAAASACAGALIAGRAATNAARLQSARAAIEVARARVHLAVGPLARGADGLFAPRDADGSRFADALGVLDFAERVGRTAFGRSRRALGRLGAHADAQRGVLRDAVLVRATIRATPTAASAREEHAARPRGALAWTRAARAFAERPGDHAPRAVLIEVGRGARLARSAVAVGDRVARQSIGRRWTHGAAVRRVLRARPVDDVDAARSVAIEKAEIVGASVERDDRDEPHERAGASAAMSA